MKGLEQFGDLLSMLVGVMGALLKGIKSKFKPSTVFVGCLVAGILTFSVIGVIEMFYEELSPKLVILVSFVVGWVANEITAKLDLLIGDLYDIFIVYLKNKFNKPPKNDKKDSN